jgi:hypothetical protein
MTLQIIAIFLRIDFYIINWLSPIGKQNPFAEVSHESLPGNPDERLQFLIILGKHHAPPWRNFLGLIAFPFAQNSGYPVIVNRKKVGHF